MLGLYRMAFCRTALASSYRPCELSTLPKLPSAENRKLLAIIIKVFKEQLTLWRIYGNGTPVQALLVPPVRIPSHGSQAHGGQQDAEAEKQDAARLLGAGHQPGDAVAHQQTEPDTGQVQEPLGHHEAHVEEEVAGGQERQRQEAAGHEEHDGVPILRRQVL